MRFRRLFTATLAASTPLAETIATAIPEDDGKTFELEEPPGDQPRADPDHTKYFHEPGSDDIMGHYDTRYYHGVVSYEEKGDTQVHMIRAYLRSFAELGLETWIAHGTLLGWWWNGKVRQGASASMWGRC